MMHHPEEEDAMKTTTKRAKPVALEFTDAEWTQVTALASFCKRTPYRLVKDIILADLLQERIVEAHRLGVV